MFKSGGGEIVKYVLAVSRIGDFHVTPSNSILHFAVRGINIKVQLWLQLPLNPFKAIPMLWVSDTNSLAWRLDMTWWSATLFLNKLGCTFPWFLLLFLFLILWAHTTLRGLPHTDYSGTKNNSCPRQGFIHCNLLRDLCYLGISTSSVSGCPPRGRKSSGESHLSN